MKIAGRYEITAKVGQGGMGVVYRAYDPAPMDREVAVKTLHEFADPLALDLFYRECRALKSISHPNIVEIFDMGEYEEGGQKRPYFVMPLLPGQTLDELIRNESHRLTVDRLVEIMSQTCRGLQAAHDRGLIHRDLKPSNIFVMADDSVKLIDFGVAHAVTARSRTTGFDKGTLLYMAPEQLQHKPVSAQSDIYALGLTMYEALTRRQPFRGGTESEVIEAILNQVPPLACDLNPSVSPLMSRVVHKAIAKQPWSRYETARAFADTLQKALRNEPIAMFDPARVQPRIQTAIKALEKGDEQFAGEIVTELEAEGNTDSQIVALRAQIDQLTRQKTIARLLDSARARYDEGEDPLALQKIHEVLTLDPANASALELKGRIDERRSDRTRVRHPDQAETVRAASSGTSLPLTQQQTVLKPPTRPPTTVSTEAAVSEARAIPQEKTRQPLSLARLVALVGGIAAVAAVALAALLWSWRTPSGSAAQPTRTPAAAPTAAAPAAAPVVEPQPPAPAPATVSTPVQPAPSAAATPAPARPPAPTPAPPRTVQAPPPPVSTPAPGPVPAAVNPAPQTQAAPPATQSPAPVVERVPAATNPPTSGIVEAPLPPVLAAARGAQLLNQAAQNEKAGDWQAALQNYERARLVDRSLTTLATAAIARVQESMHADGADAFKRAREYEAMNRTEDAIAWYERAFRNLPENSADKRTAADRLRALKSVR